MIYESARALLADMPHIDSLICDPPYSQHVHESAVSNNPGGVETGTRKREFFFTHLTKELRSTIADISCVTSRWTCIFTDIESVSTWIQELPCEVDYVRSVPWIRWSQPQKSGDRPCSGCEMIVCAHAPGRKRWNGPGSLTHFDERALRGRDKHATEKPLDLMLSLVSWFSDPGETVCDPCCGSGTTALACRLLDRQFTGAELDPKWRTIAIARAEQDLSERDLKRAERWVMRSLDWYESEKSVTPKAKQRRLRALADVELVCQKIKV